MNVTDHIMTFLIIISANFFFVIKSQCNAYSKCKVVYFQLIILSAKYTDDQENNSTISYI